jgi:hypothetical protein
MRGRSRNMRQPAARNLIFQDSIWTHEKATPIVCHAESSQ